MALMFGRQIFGLQIVRLHANGAPISKGLLLVAMAVCFFAWGRGRPCLDACVSGTITTSVPEHRGDVP